MGLNRPTQQLRRELLDMASRQEELAGKICRIAESLDSQLGLALLTLLQDAFSDADKLKALAEEVKTGQVIRQKPQCQSQR